MTLLGWGVPTGDGDDELLDPTDLDPLMDAIARDDA